MLITAQINKLAEIDPNAAYPTIRSILLNFPDDLECAELDEYDDPAFFATIMPFFRELRDLLNSNDYSAPLEREQLTELALSLSLCPIHLIDYAICFDDNDAECAQIRMIHPIHDT